MGKKYELTDITREYEGKTLYRIRALRDFGEIKAGDYGGWIESEENLSQTNKCWLCSGIACDKAMIFGDAIIVSSELRDTVRVYGDAFVVGSCLSGNAKIFGGVVQYATVTDHAEVYDQAKILGIADSEDVTIINGHAEVYGKATIHFASVIGGKAKIHGDSEVFGKVYGKAEITGNAKVMGEITGGRIISTNYIFG